MPPHCTHKLQPLDIGLMKPFQTFYNAAVDFWMMAHPGETFSIYDVAACVGYAYPKAMKPENIYVAFKKAGIFPYDRHIFKEENFLPKFSQALSSLHDYNVEISDNNPNNPSRISDSDIMQTPTGKQLSPTSKAFISPEDVRGFPKAKPRTSGKRPRRRGRTMITTDTPEKIDLEASKKSGVKKNPKKVKKRIFKDLDDDDSGDNVTNVVLQDSSDDENFHASSPEPNITFGDLDREPSQVDYVLVKFFAKSDVYYIGKIISCETADEFQITFLRKCLKVHQTADEFQITFLRKCLKVHQTFIYPNISDVAVVPKSDIQMILPRPKKYGKTKHSSIRRYQM
ncbi:hypothetical protein QE152_g35288 [Popillia japonica]|uniref:DDE-1 domain-containing protein n=1 Tax=Popillia japonica TaxID=7064 RepID=A0AAW1IFQ0_POPJA